MFRNNNHGNGHNRNQSVDGFCICPKCGYSIPHSKGIPCSSKACPNCKTWLVRSEVASTKETISSESATQTSQKPTPPVINYPVVDADLCIACGVCIDICPTNAIVLKDDKAFIINDLCRNCRKCVRVCPSGAIN
jgi:hypothetical protein